MKNFADEKGQALFLAVMATLLFFLLGISVLTMVNESRKALFVEKTMVQAYYAADAGVERVLAKAKSDGDWLWETVHLASGKEVMFIDKQGYGGGEISKVTVKEDGIYPINPTAKEDVVYTDISITSIGTYEGSNKTLKVTARVRAPLQFTGGVWVNAADTELGGARIISHVISSGDLFLRYNGTFSGEINAAGTITVSENTVLTADEIKAAKSIILQDNAQISGTVRQAGDKPEQMALAEGAWIDGDIYYNGLFLNNSGKEIDAAKLHESGAGIVRTPSFPVLEPAMFKKSNDQIYTGDETISGDFLLNGVVYVAGDVTISGAYKGVGAIVAAGNVNIAGDLKRYYDDPGSSLTIICFGGQGITVGAGAEVWALLYTPPGNAAGDRSLHIGDAAQIHGGLICSKVMINPNASVLIQYENSLVESQPDWLTTNIEITAWHELYSVFSSKEGEA